MKMKVHREEFMKVQSVLAIICLFVFSSCAQFSERDPASSSVDFFNKKSVLVSFYEGNEDAGMKTQAVISGVSEKGLDGHEKWFAIRFKVVNSSNRSQDFYIQAANKTQADCIEKHVANGSIQGIMIDQSHNLMGRDFNDKLFFQTTLISSRGENFAQEYCPNQNFSMNSMRSAQEFAVLPLQFRR
jgi:hypothetical protein